MSGLLVGQRAAGGEKIDLLEKLDSVAHLSFTSHFLDGYPCSGAHFYGIPLYPAVSPISRCILLYPAVSCHIPPYLGTGYNEK